MRDIAIQNSSAVKQLAHSPRPRIGWKLWFKLRCAAALQNVWELLPGRWEPRIHYGLISAARWLPEASRDSIGRITGRLRARRAGIGQDYAAWMRLYDQLDIRHRRTAQIWCERTPNLPLISIIMPVFNPRPDDLRAALQSVEQQVYPAWELCIADDASTDPAVIDVLKQAQARDHRIKVTYRESNGHIAAASNSALALATGSFIGLLDHDDVLSPFALYEVAARLKARPEADIVYSDEDKIDQDGNRSDPYFKPDWNPELMLGQNLINHFGVFRRSIVQDVGGFRSGLDGSQDYDLGLRVAARSKPENVLHIARVLYHWRQSSSVQSYSEKALSACADAGRQAVWERLAPEVPGVRVAEVPGAPAWHRVIYPVPRPEPLVSVIIPTRNHARMLERTIRGLLEETDYQALEILIVDNGSDEPDALDLIDSLESVDRVQIIRAPGPFNYSALNNRAVAEANGSLLLLLNNDVSVIHPDWLAEMVSHAVRPEVGAVGAKLLYPNGTIQHGGVTIGVGGVAAHQYLHQPRRSSGYFGHLLLARNVSAVTGACLMVRRELFNAIGALNATDLPVAFNDIDLCLRLEAAGYRNVWTPHAELYHHESASRGSDRLAEKALRFKRECDYMRRRWGARLHGDPYWNPNLELSATELMLAFPPRTSRDTESPGIRA